MRIVGNNPQLSRQTQGTASGAITGGLPVVVNTDGTVGVPNPDSVGSATIFNTNYTNYIIMAFDSNSNKVVVAWSESSNNHGQAAVGTVSGTSITFGTTVTFSATNSTQPSSIVFDSNANKVAIFYNKAGVGKAIVGTVSGTDISFGTEAQFHAEPTLFLASATFDSNSNKIVFAYRAASSSNYGTAVVGTISGTDISFGTAVVFESATTANMSLSFDSTNNKVVITYTDAGNSNYGTAIVGTVSGTGISFGSATTFTSSAVANYMVNAYDPDQQKTIVAYANSGSSNVGEARVGTVSGTSISFGDANNFDTPASGNAASYVGIAYDPSNDKIVIANSNGGFSVVAGTVSGNTITFGADFVIDTDTSGAYSTVVFDSSNNKLVVAYYDGNNGGKGTAHVLTLGTGINLTSENFIGFAQDTVATGQPVTINTKGAIADNMPSLSATLSGGTAAVFESATTAKIGSTFDSSNNKIVIAYRDEGNSEHGTAIVGTVSGTDISFGSPTVFESAAVGFLNENSIVFDSNANKVVIAYEDEGNSQYGTAVVGTVSGTSISFGTPVVFESAQTFSTAIAFDSSNNKVVIAYEDQANSEHGTAIVGTVSGTSISFGSATVFNAGDTLNIRAAFDSTNNKVVIAYTDAGNSNQGTAIVGTVSGTSISFGSETVFDTSTGSKNNLGKSIVFDSNAEKMLISYVNVGDSEHGYAIVGTVSGTSISFGSAAEFENAGTTDISSAFDSSNNLVVIAYRDDGNSFYGTAVTASISGTSVSFTSPVVFESARADEISIAYDSSNNKAVTAFQDAGNSDHGTAVVLSVDTSLTIGQTYYVQTDGTLSETADDPSVTAGTAVAGSTLIVKG